MPTPGSAASPTQLADIEITDDAVRAFASAIDPDEDPFENYSEDAAIARVGLALAAPHIGAAYLRRIADEIGGTDYGRVAAQVLHQCASELDGGAQ